jgi:glutamate--cysteine ligase
MRSYLPTRGALALDMMFTTATVQANFDYESEADMVAKMRMGLAVSPLVSAIFANSSVSEGKANGFATRRLHIWTQTDPDRCGLIPFVFHEGYGYREYVEWALDIPMFFLIRDGQYRPAHTTTFRRFLREGFEGERATLADFDRHLTTLFPDVRLKRGVIEMRGADAVPPGLTCSLPAIWKGLLYDREALEQAYALVASFDADVREAARADVARRGLGAQYGGEPVLELAREVARISRAGLVRLAHKGRRDADETGFLDPVFAQLELGASPGTRLAQQWEGDWGRSVDRLIEYARY